jgi:hypothetical protein
MAIGISSFQTIYQTYYPDASLPYLVPKEAVLLNMFLGGNTDGQVSGDVVDMPWLFGPSTGVSQTYSTAANLANNAPQALRPTVRMSQLYKNASFLDKDNILSQGEASYGELMETVIAGYRADFLNKVDQLFHGNGTGNRCAVTYTNTNAAKLPLVSAPTQLTNDTGAKLGAPVGQAVFEKNDSVVLTSTNPNDGTAPTVVAGPFSISSVDGVANTITLSADPGLVDGRVYGVALAGDTLGFSAALLLPALIGVAAYNPYGGPTAGESFLGVDRSVYGTRTAGTYFDGSVNYSMEQAIRKGATAMKNTGVETGGVTACLYPDDYDTLDFKMTSQNRYSSHELGVVFFDSIAISSTMGRLNIVVDTHQQKGQARLYAPNACQLMYRGGLPHFATLSTGLDEQWGNNYDGREKRMRAYLQLRCRDPRKLNVTLLPQSI